MFLFFKFIKRMALLVLIVLIVFLLNGVVEKGFANRKIAAFKARGELVATSDDNVKNHYYKVTHTFDYEDTTRPIFDIEKRIIGGLADIIVTNRNPMRGFPNISWVMEPVFKELYLGHATINVNEQGDQMMEVVGNSTNASQNIVSQIENHWLTYEEQLGDESISPMIIGLRVKNTTQQERQQAVDFALAQEGKPYNFTFLFNRTKSFYCTDLVSRAYEDAGIGINYDFFATTGIDLIVNQKLYIIFVREIVIIDNETHFNYYYLE